MARAGTNLQTGRPAGRLRSKERAPSPGLGMARQLVGWHHGRKRVQDGRLRGLSLWHHVAAAERLWLPHPAMPSKGSRTVLGTQCVPPSTLRPPLANIPQDPSLKPKENLFTKGEIRAFFFLFKLTIPLYFLPSVSDKGGRSVLIMFSA